MLAGRFSHLGFLDQRVDSSRLWQFAIVVCTLSAITTSVNATPTRIAPSLQKITSGFTATPAERAAGAVVLDHSINVTLQSDGNSTRTEYVAVSVLDDKAIDQYRQISEDFSSFYTKVHLDFARVMDSQGRIHEAAADGIQEKATTEPYTVNDARTLTFALPGLDKGAVLEFQITYVSKPSIAGQWFANEPFNYIQRVSAGDWPRIDPVRTASLVVDVPRGMALRYKPHLLKVTADQTSVAHRITYRWNRQNLPAVPVENYMTQFIDVLPGLRISTLPDWKAFDAWASNIYFSAAIPGSTESALVRELITDGMDNDQRIAALFHYEQANIRYISAHLANGGYVPHPSAEVLRNRYGDCKDQAVLLIALLRAAGVEAYPALVGMPGAAIPDPDLPVPRFSHMIVYVPGRPGGLWLDTTGSVYTFPGIDSYLEDSIAFVVDGRGGKLLPIPRTAPQHNAVTMRVDYRYDHDALMADVDLRATGTIGDRLKSSLRDHAQSIEQFKGMLKGVFSNARQVAVRLDTDADSHKPFAIAATFALDSGWSSGQETVPCAGSIAPLLALFTPFANLPSPDTRRYDFNAGMAMDLTMETRCAAPSASYRPTFRQLGQAVHSDAFYTDVKRREEGDREIVTTRFVLNQPVIEQTHYREFVAEIDSAAKQSEWRLDFKKDSGYVEGKQLEKDAQDSGRTVVAVLKLARHELDVANYARARDLANEAVSKDPKSGEGFYLLGISAGFLDDIKASDAALQKAKGLGYRP